MLSTRVAVFLRSNGWVLNLAFLALGSYFLAGAANAVVERNIRLVPTAESMPSQLVHVASLTSQRAPAAAVAERNLLGLKRETMVPAEQQAAPTMAVGRNFNESELQACSVPATLRATLVAENNPEFSLAVIVSNATREPTVYTVNDGSNQISDDAWVVAIRSREIVVRRRDHFERCLGEGEQNTPGPPPLAPPPLAMGGDEPPEPRPGDMTGVTKLSETDYRVERAEVDRALNNLNEVATQARIVPSFKNGKANGFKLFSIKNGSIYSKIGLQNGDVIQKINGYDMNSPDRALEIYTKLRNVTSLTIELQRRGATITLNYAIN